MRHIISRILHRPIPAVAVILFAVIISISLCAMQQSNAAELAAYESAYHEIPVSFTITDLFGMSKNDQRIPGWLAGLFVGNSAAEPDLSQYAGDLQIETSTYIHGEYESYTLTGITSSETAKQVDPGQGGKVTWFDGYDNHIFSSSELLCVVPLALYEEKKTDSITLEFWELSSTQPLGPERVNYDKTYKSFYIAGTYENDSDNRKIFCPFSACFNIQSVLKREITVPNISGVLNDNYTLEQFRQDSSQWFASPNPLGEQTPWGRMGYEYYLYAIDINSTLLDRVISNYQISIAINRMSAMLILAFSAAAGFIVGFLMIRSRKRELSLMRILGEGNGRIYLDLAAEQMLCILAGTLLGGLAFSFNAPKLLLLFAAMYFVGLTAAIVFFLNRNLLATIKEDE